MQCRLGRGGPPAGCDAQILELELAQTEVALRVAVLVEGEVTLTLRHSSSGQEWQGLAPIEQRFPPSGTQGTCEEQCPVGVAEGTLDLVAVP